MRTLVGFLATQPDLAVIAEAGEGTEGIRLAIEHRPDVAIVDQAAVHAWRHGVLGRTTER